MFLSLCSYLIILFFSFIIVELYFKSQTSNTEIINHGVSYLRTVMILSFGTMFQWVLERLLIATGKSHLFMITLSTGAIINIILDPIFIFGYFGIPAMGVQGAAIATVFGQCTSAGLALLLNYTHNKELNMQFSLKPHKNTLVKILKTGIPTSFIQGFTSITSIAINMILISFSSTAVALYGVITRVLNMILVIPYGMGNGVIPIIAYNYGAKNKERIMKTIKYAIIYILCACIVGVGAVQILANQILDLFNPSNEMIKIGIEALRIISFVLPFSGINVVLSASYQGLGQAKYSMYLSLLRQIILLLPIVYLMSLFNTLKYIWLAFPLAELLALIVGFILLETINKKVISKIEANILEHILLE